jgi:hypothetical protein
MDNEGEDKASKMFRSKDEGRTFTSGGTINNCTAEDGTEW